MFLFINALNKVDSAYYQASVMELKRKADMEMYEKRDLELMPNQAKEINSLLLESIKKYDEIPKKNYAFTVRIVISMLSLNQILASEYSAQILQKY